MKRGKVLAVVLGMFLGSELTWGLPPDKERVGVSREVVRILLSEVQVAEMKLAQVRLEVVRFSGSQEHGPAILLRGEGIVTVAGKEDRVLLLADTASGFSGQWRKLSRGEVMQVPVKLTVRGETLSGALVVWEREGQRQGRFVVEETAGMGVSLLGTPEPRLPSREVEIHYYSDSTFTEEVGWELRLCNGTTVREGVVGPVKWEISELCSGGGGSSTCAEFSCNRCAPGCVWCSIECPWYN